MEELNLSEKKNMKRVTLENCLTKGMTSIVVSCENPFVKIPDKFRGDKQIKLNLSHRFNLPRFEITPWGVIAALSFDNQPFTVRIPWEAIVTIIYNREVYKFGESSELMEAPSQTSLKETLFPDSEEETEAEDDDDDTEDKVEDPLTQVVPTDLPKNTVVSLLEYRQKKYVH